jgi:hypothetical protein
MNDAEVLEYLQSHAPLDSFYLCAGDTLLRFKDEAGKAWILMEDNDKLAARAAELLKARGVKVFDDFFAMLEYEKQSKGSGKV